MSFFAELNPEWVRVGNAISGAFYNPGNSGEAAARMAANREGQNTGTQSAPMEAGLKLGNQGQPQTQQPYGPPQQAQLTGREINARLPQGGIPPGMPLGGNQARETYNTISGAGGRDLTDRYNQLAGLSTPNYSDPRLMAGYGGQAPQPGGHGSIGAAGFQNQLNNIRALRADVEAAFNQRNQGAGADALLRSNAEASKAYNQQIASLAGDFRSARSPEERGAIAMQMKALGLSFGEGNKLVNTAMQGQTQLDQATIQGQNQLANTQLQGQNQLAAYGLQGQNQMANTQLQGQNQLAAYGLQGVNQMAVEQMRQNSPQALALTRNYMAQADNYERQANQQPQDPWSTPDGARATADFISATQGMTPQQIAQAQMAARGPQPQIVTYQGRQYVRGPNGEAIPYNPQGAK